MERTKEDYRKMYYLRGIDLLPQLVCMSEDFERLSLDVLHDYYAKGYLFETRDYALGIARCLRNVAFPKS